MSDQTAEVRVRLGLDVAGSHRAVEKLAKELKAADHSVAGMVARQREYNAVARISAVARRDYFGTAAGMGDARSELTTQRAQREADRARAWNQLQARRELAGSTIRLTQLREEARLQAETARVERRERLDEIKVSREARRADLQGRYGARLGSMIAGAEHPAARAAIGAAGWAGAGVTGLAMSGFSGTAQAERLHFEVQLLTRELGGAFRPALEWTSSALNRLRHFLEKLTGRQQDLLMYTAGSLALAKAGSMAYRGLGGAGLLEAAGFSAAAIASRRPGAAAAAALPGTVGAGELGGAGAAAGAGAVGRGAMVARLLRGGAYVNAGLEGYRASTGEHHPPAEKALKVGPLAAVNIVASQFSDDWVRDVWNYPLKLGERHNPGSEEKWRRYQMGDSSGNFAKALREKVGLERGESLIGRAGRGLGEYIDESTGGKTSFGRRLDFRDPEKVTGSKGDDHRKVTPTVPSLFDAPGTAYDRVALASANMSGLDQQAQGGGGFIGDLIAALDELWERKQNKTQPPENG